MGDGADAIVVREAREADINGIRDIFMAVYGEDYPYQTFYDDLWLKRSVFSDDILMLVAEDTETDEVLGTASVVFDIGAHSDLIGEFGRLAVHPKARGRGIGKLLMENRIAFIQNRLHVGVVENRTVHPYSQRISHAFGFAPVGFLPLKHLFNERESIALFCRHFGASLTLRCNHPRIVPEAHPLAHLALENCGLPFDCIVDEVSAPYPHDTAFVSKELTAEGLPLLMRIERGRVRNREIFGPMRLQYGFFKLTARRATYLVARQQTADGPGAIAGAIGYIRDDAEKAVRVFELITRTDHVNRFLFEELVRRCEDEWGVDYIEVDVSAHAPRMQRTLLELGFLPTAYVPAMVFHEVERLDVVKMSRLLVPPELGDIQLSPKMQIIADQVMRAFVRQAVLPQIAGAVERLQLFRGLNEEQSTRVAGVCTVVSYASGEQLWARGDQAETMAILIQGDVAIELDGQRVGTVGEGESVGEVSLLTREPHSARAIALDQVHAAQLSARALAELSRQRPDIAVVLYRNLATSLGRKLQRVDRAIAAR